MRLQLMHSRLAEAAGLTHVHSGDSAPQTRVDAALVCEQTGGAWVSDDDRERVAEDPLWALTEADMAHRG